MVRVVRDMALLRQYGYQFITTGSWGSWLLLHQVKRAGFSMLEPRGISVAEVRERRNVDVGLILVGYNLNMI